MKVLGHGVGTPTAKKFDCIEIDVGTYEGRGAPSAEGLGINFAGLEIQSIGALNVDAGMEGLGDLL